MKLEQAAVASGGVSPAGESHRRRTDIQALRGLAVLLVVFYHAGLGVPAGGYLGVDIFFVISGFLITRRVSEGLIDGSFTFSGFYLGRARRILPAAYVTIGVTALVAAMLLDPFEVEDFIRSTLASIGFVANVALWRDVGYFDTAADLQPLLHMWSLAVEEQYYLFLPLALFLTPPRWWLRAGCVATLASLIACLLVLRRSELAAFYLLPFRAWELGLGSIAALGISRVSGAPIATRWLFWPACLVLLAIPIAPLSARSPDIDSVLVCVAAMIVILRNHPLLSTPVVHGSLARVGDVSYSLYLVHWPVFSFIRNVYVTPVPLEATVAGLLAVALLAVALNRTVEAPFLRISLQRRGLWTAGLAAATAALILVALVPAALDRQPSFASEAVAPNHGLSRVCDSNAEFITTAECRTGDAPQILVWGDSFAMHLVPGIAASTSEPIAQATKSSCGPFLDLAPMRSIAPTAEECIAFNHRVLANLEATPSIETVILSSPFHYYLGGESARFLLRTSGGTFGVVETSNAAAAMAALERTIAAVRALDRDVVIVAPPPTTDLDIARCLERAGSGKILIGSDDCMIDRAEFHAARADVLTFLAAVAQRANVSVISLEDALCRRDRCQTMLDGVPLYRDSGHLTVAGSRLLGPRMNLATRILAEAR